MIFIAAIALIVPSTPPGILRIGVSIYACMISIMLLLALLQRDLMSALGAALFVISDFILAWVLFVDAIPHSGYLIMIPYYAAEWILYEKSTSLRISK